MATIHVTIGPVRNLAFGGQVMPVPASQPTAAETLTSTGSSATGTISAGANSSGLFWSVTAQDGDVFVAFGAEPEAGPDEGHLVLQGETRDFGVSEAGETIAVVDA